MTERFRNSLTRLYALYCFVAIFPFQSNSNETTDFINCAGREIRLRIGWLHWFRVASGDGLTNAARPSVGIKNFHTASESFLPDADDENVPKPSPLKFYLHTGGRQSRVNCVFLVLLQSPLVLSHTQLRLLSRIHVFATSSFPVVLHTDQSSES